MKAPMAPTAPKARLRTPVVRQRTTTPTPSRAYTPPSARPVTMNGLKLSRGGIECCARPLLAVALCLLDLPDLRDGGLGVGDGEALLLDDHLAVLRRGGPVGVVRDVQRRLAEVPGLAQDAGLEVLHVLDRGVDALGRVVVVLDPEHRL